MPGDEWQRFANLRLMFSYMFTHPGTKLLFMGGEFGQTSEWSLENGLEWWLTEYPYHAGMQELIRALNHLYRSQKALFEQQFDHWGFEWIEIGDYENSVISFVRRGKSREDTLVVACNFTPVVREGYRIGVPEPGAWREIFNSDDNSYGGSGYHHQGERTTVEGEWHGRPQHLAIDLPPLATIIMAKS
jgi:1,4-alpha-glucan branching enzyme